MLEESLSPDVHFDGGTRDRADSKYLEGVPGGGLLALLYGTALTRGDFPSIYGDPGDEAGPVRGALLGDHPVRRPEPVSLQSLLEERLPVAQFVGIDLCWVEDLIKGPQHQVPVN